MSTNGRVRFYRCNWRIKHNGESKRPGEAIGMAAAAAAPLLASGAIEAAEEAAAEENAMLLGSNVLPSHVEIADGRTVQLGEVVRRAHEESGLSVEDWNGLDDENREARLAAAVEAMKAEAEAEAEKARQQMDDADEAAKKAAAKRAGAKKASAKQPSARKAEGG